MIGVGNSPDNFYQRLGFGALNKVAELQTQRENFNKQVKAQQTSNTLSGAVSGAELGGQIGGPWGAAAGAVIGGLTGHFL